VYRDEPHAEFGFVNPLDVAGVTEERRLLEEIAPFLVAQINVDLFQVAGAVVAADAGEIDPQENLAEQDGNFIVRVGLVDLVEIVAVVGSQPGLTFHMLADDRVYSRNHVVALGGGRNQVAGKIIIRTVGGKTVFYHEMEKFDAALHFAVGTDQVEIEI